MLGSIDQIGWKMVSPTKLRDHNGRDVDLLAGSPARLKKLMCQALENQLEQEFVKACSNEALVQIRSSVRTADVA